METELDYSRSPDWYLLKIKLGYFESRQSNDQECNWGLHEDSHEIVERLNELNTLLVIIIVSVIFQLAFTVLFFDKHYYP